MVAVIRAVIIAFAIITVNEGILINDDGKKYYKLYQQRQKSLSKYYHIKYQIMYDKLYLCVLNFSQTFTGMG